MSRDFDPLMDDRSLVVAAGAGSPLVRPEEVEPGLGEVIEVSDHEGVRVFEVALRAVVVDQTIVELARVRIDVAVTTEIGRADKGARIIRLLRMARGARDR